jgi:beta-glucanase (GH16 family)
MKAPTIPGIVSTFILMGPNLPDAGLDLSNTDPQGGDEIDWEIVGGDPKNAQSNIFYRGYREFAIRGGIHPVPSGVDASQKYTIDWRSDRIIFLINDQVQRTYYKNSTEADSEYVPNRRFFPDRAGKVQFALWSEATNAWAGGAAKWPLGVNSTNAKFEYIDIQCYNDKDQPVPKWPLQNNPDMKPTIKFQPTQGVSAKIPPEAGPQFTGTIPDPNYKPASTSKACAVQGDSFFSTQNSGVQAALSFLSYLSPIFGYFVL